MQFASESSSAMLGICMDGISASAVHTLAICPDSAVGVSKASMGAALALAAVALMAAAAVAVFAVTTTGGGVPSTDLLAELTAYVQAAGEGGFVDPRLELRRFAGVRGLGAREAIEADDTVALIPWAVVLGIMGPGPEPDSGVILDACATVRVIADELALNASSRFWPHLRDCAEAAAATRLPGWWGPKALSELQEAPPYDADRHVRWWAHACMGVPLPVPSPFALEAHVEVALVVFVTRTLLYGIVPVFDLFNHAHGFGNVAVEVTALGVRLHTRGAVAAGAQLLYNYGAKTTPELLRDYGFVQELPRTWTWESDAAHVFVFAVFPGDLALISPDIRAASPHDFRGWKEEEWSTRVPAWNRQLPGDELKRFVAAAEAWIARSPTTVEQDEARLMGLEEEGEEDEQDVDGDVDVDVDADVDVDVDVDVRTAIQYRVKFKRELHVAVASAKAVLLETARKSASASAGGGSGQREEL